MDGIRGYFLCVVAAAIICAVAGSLSIKGTSKAVVKLISGIFLTFTVIRPLAQLDLDDASAFLPSYSREAEAASAEGEFFANEALADIIKAESEAYILDKAAALNAALSVEVTVSDAEMPLPVSARLHGNVSPYVRQRLQSVISQDLGIPEEEQLWMQ